jgi:hypothetical protein
LHVQMGVTVERAMRETLPGSALHVAAAAKLWHIAHCMNRQASTVESASKLVQLAVRARYGDVGALFPKILDSYVKGSSIGEHSGPV